MAKKKTNKKTTTKKTAKTSAVKKSPTKKPAAKKAASKKTTTKKPAAKKTAPKKSTAKKPAAKKTTTKKAPAKKPVSKKPVSKKVVTKKPASKKVAKKPTAKKAPARKAPAASKAATHKGGPTKPGAGAASATGRKGITIVDEKKKHRRTRSSAKAKLVPRPPMPSLLGPNSRFKGPLIPSGPKNKLRDDGSLADSDGSKKKKKTPFKKRQLDKFKEILLRKRAEVFGDLEELETGALRSGGSGGLSKTPQHDAEQGTDSADQNLSLNLAEADRNLIHEIDAALERIANKTYGLCSITDQPISEARLEELPWAQHSIEAARRLERGHS